MIRWLRVVLPPAVWLLVSGTASAITVALPYCKHRWRVDVPEVRQIGFVFVSFGIVGYAFHRVHTFHPGFQPAYRDWLATTPWTSRQALPLGPVDGYAAPISLRGRLMTGRWLIAGYDRVFVAPLLATWVILIGMAELIVLRQSFTAPVLVGLVLLISLGMGPSFAEWRLTGNHRIWEGTERKYAIKVG